QGQIVARSVLQRRLLLLADTHAYDEVARARQAAQVVQRGGDAPVGKAHAVDPRPVVGQAEDARARVAGLGIGGQRADLDVAEAERRQAGGDLRLLVEARGDAEHVGEAQAGDDDRLRGDRAANLL